MNLAIFGIKTFIILDILKTLEYFCRTLLFRPFLMFGRILNMPVRQNVLLSLHSYYVLFQPYSEKFKHYSRECSRIFRTLCISGIFKTWYVPITKHIQTPRYIHNTILSIFTKAASWVFDTVLSAPSRVIGYL